MRRVCVFVCYSPTRVTEIAAVGGSPYSGRVLCQLEITTGSIYKIRVLTADCGLGRIAIDRYIVGDGIADFALVAIYGKRLRVVHRFGIGSDTVGNMDIVDIIKIRPATVDTIIERTVIDVHACTVGGTLAVVHIDKVLLVSRLTYIHQCGACQSEILEHIRCFGGKDPCIHITECTAVYLDRVQFGTRIDAYGARGETRKHTAEHVLRTRLGVAYSLGGSLAAVESQSVECSVGFHREAR